jgi:iron(III) transport system substrate-binding protein
MLHLKRINTRDLRLIITKSKRYNYLSVNFSMAAIAMMSATLTTAAEVNIYSARQPFLISNILNDFTQSTGIVTNIVYAKSDISKRLQLEGALSAADIVLTSDIAPLYDLAQKGLTQTVSSALLEKNIPNEYRDPQQQWFGLTARARIIFASKDRVKLGEIADYEQLTDQKWQGRICTRSAKHNYMLSLISSMITANGETATEQWLKGLKDNLARKPQGNDRAQVKAISEGVCDLALVNSYYFVKMITNKRKPDQVKSAQSVFLIFPNQQSRGSHMNISGMALTKYAPNKRHAIALMEYLSSDKAQEIYASQNHEFPINPKVKPSKFLQQYMPNFKRDNISLAAIAEQHQKALSLIKKVGL